MDDTDHYVCTILPHGRRIQVGPMSLPGARVIAAHLKTKSESIAYATWVDWRRLNRYPLLSISAFRAEVSAPTSVRQPPTLPLGQYSDRILIEELKGRGFVVPKKSHVWNLTCQQAYPVYEYEAMSHNPEWMKSAHRSLARRMGDRLFEGGAFETRAVAGAFGETVLQMESVVIAPEAT